MRKVAIEVADDCNECKRKRCIDFTYRQCEVFNHSWIKKYKTNNNVIKQKPCKACLDATIKIV